jgi:hypothetical protein
MQVACPLLGKDVQLRTSKDNNFNDRILYTATNIQNAQKPLKHVLETLINIFLRANFSISLFLRKIPPKIWPPPKKSRKILKNSAIDSSPLAASDSVIILELRQSSRSQIIN